VTPQFALQAVRDARGSGASWRVSESTSRRLLLTPLIAHGSYVAYVEQARRSSRNRRAAGHEASTGHPHLAPPLHRCPWTRRSPAARRELSRRRALGTQDGAAEVTPVPPRQPRGRHHGESAKHTRPPGWKPRSPRPASAKATRALAMPRASARLRGARWCADPHFEIAGCRYRRAPRSPGWGLHRRPGSVPRALGLRRSPLVIAVMALHNRLVEGPPLSTSRRPFV